MCACVCVCVCACACACACACVCVCVCVCVVTCSNFVNRVTLGKRTSKRYNFVSTFTIEMYLGKHIYLCK